MTIDALIEQEIILAVQELYGATVDSKSVQISDTKKEIAGDKTVVIFPLARISKKSPEDTANELGAYLVSHIDAIESYSVIKGFLNLTISVKYWLSVLQTALQQGLEYGKKPVNSDSSFFVPSVTVANDWVSPREKIAEPWRRGNTPTCAESGRISCWARPSMRLHNIFHPWISPLNREIYRQHK